MTVRIDSEVIYRYSGKILLLHEIPLEPPFFEKLLAASYFTSIPSIQKKKLFYQCNRCGNDKRSLFGTIPCQRCGKTHLYCRKCIEMGRVMTCEALYEWTGPKAKWPVWNEPCTWRGELTQAQEKAALRIQQAITTQEKEVLIWAVCGAGKTEMLFPGITEALKMGKRICIATPRADVVRELLPRIQQAFSAVSVQALYGKSKTKEGNAQLLVATTHQLLRYKTAFDVLVIDEIDAFPYHIDPSLAYAVERSKKGASTTIYLTATPRKEQKLLISRKKLPHIFVPARFHGYPLPVPVFYMILSLQKELQRSEPPVRFLKWFAKRLHPERQLLIFVPTIALSEKLGRKLSEYFNGLSVLTVNAADQDREEKVNLFRAKKADVIVTTTILERGVTFPSVDVAVLDAGHDVFDEAALVQIAGRAGRSPQDPKGEVVFFHDGKTDAMVSAIRAIQKMNKRGG